MLDSNYKNYVLKKDIPSLVAMLENLDKEKHPEEIEYITERVKDLKIDQALGSNLSGNNPSDTEDAPESISLNTSQQNTIELSAKEIRNSDPIKGTFWLRILALVIDYLFLGLLGFILGIFFSEQFAGMGQSGIFIGFIITLLYFGFGDSSLSKGTIGKKILSLIVVDADYQTLSFKKSIYRALIKTSPYFLNGIALPMFGVPQSVNYVLTSMFSVIFISYPIIYIINTHTRQTITDLIMKSYVVDSKKRAGELSSSPRYSWIIAISAALLLSISPMFIFKLNPFVKLGDLQTTWSKINKIDGIIESGINVNEMNFINFGDENSRVKTVANITLRLKENLVSNNSPSNVQNIDLVQDALRTFLLNYKNLDKIDSIKVTISYGYSIGIFHKYENISQAGTLVEWSRLVY